jgi:hypothetical protein
LCGGEKAFALFGLDWIRLKLSNLKGSEIDDGTVSPPSTATVCQKQPKWRKSLSKS